MKPLIALTITLLILAGCAEPVAEPAPESIILSYGYGTRGVTTTPFGDDGPVVVACETYYEIV
jgi:hypothetical protein